MYLDLGQLQALQATVDAGSLDGAAQRLHVTPSAVSQRIKALETTIGRALLVRARPVTTTPAGERVLRLARQIDLLQADVSREFTETSDAGPVELPIAVNADSLDTWLLPALSAAGEGWVFDLHREDEDQTAALLRDGTVVAAVTTARDAMPGCSSTLLGALRYRPVATPDFVAHWFPDGATPDALAKAPVVHFDRNDDLQRGWLRERGGDRVSPPGHHIPSTEAFEMAVRSGLGWGMLSEYQLAGDRSPAVVTFADAAVEVRLYWQRWRFATPSLDRLTELVIAAARSGLSSTPGG